MRKTIFKSVLVALVATTSFISCSSDPVESTVNASHQENDIFSKPPPPALAQFFYKEGGAFGYSTVSNPYAKANTKRIFAINSGFTVIEIQLSSLAVGTYTINSLNKFFYKKPTTTKTWQAIKGTVTISFNAAGLLSGTYNMTSGTGIASVNSVSGYFETLPIVP
jgi:hypothetical protein